MIGDKMKKITILAILLMLATGLVAAKEIDFAENLQVVSVSL